MQRPDDSSSPGVEMTIVSLPPTRTSNPAAALKKLAPLLQEERRRWKGIDTAFSGFAQGIRPRATAPSHEDAEMRNKELLKELIDSEPRPPLVKFAPLKEVTSVPHPRTSQSELVYRLYKTDGKLVRIVLEQAGFSLTDGQDWHFLWAGAAPPLSFYEVLSETQKINHFPGSTQLTRKDLMYNSLLKLQTQFGKSALDFVPETYILPEELPNFERRFREATDVSWIAKPSASSQGKGIFLVESLAQVQLTEPYVVSQYIATPLLINSLKFDMRVYVLVTSYEPLRIYVYDEGLARFASEEYTGLSRKDARFMHLTNYSVNKRNEHYVQNQDYRKDNVGHKWSLSALFKHLESMSVDIEFVWAKIYDLVIKAVVSVQEAVANSASELGVTSRNCFDLFGFDILLDSSLKPWLLEVNLSPSLATETSLDLFVKGHLLTDTFNLVGVRAGERRKEGAKGRMRIRNKRMADSGPALRPAAPVPQAKPFPYGSSRFRDSLRDTLEEFDRRGHFTRVYPSKGTDYYHQFFPQTSEGSRWVYSLLFDGASLDFDQIPLGLSPSDISVQGLLHQSRMNFSRPRNASIASRRQIPDNIRHFRGRTKEKRILSALQRDKSFSTAMKTQTERIVVTGDDILMEYVSRLIRALGSVNEEALSSTFKHSIEAFVTHPVWKNSDSKSIGREALWQRLEARYSEMRIRRMKITESEAKIKGAVRESPLAEEQRRNVVAGFSAQQLEEMLRASTRNTAREVVLPLIDHMGGGVLSDLLSTLALQKCVSSQFPHEEEESDKSPTISPRSKRRSSLEQFPQVLRVSWKLKSNRPQSMAKSMRG